MASLPRGLVARFARLTSHSSDNVLEASEGEVPLCMKEEVKVVEEKEVVVQCEEELERVRGLQGTLRERLERLTQLKHDTKHGAFEPPHIRAYNLISYVEDAQDRDPLVYPSRAHNPFVILKPQDG